MRSAPGPRLHILRLGAAAGRGREGAGGWAGGSRTPRGAHPTAGPGRAPRSPPASGPAVAAPGFVQPPRRGPRCPEAFCAAGPGLGAAEDAERGVPHPARAAAPWCPGGTRRPAAALSSEPSARFGCLPFVLCARTKRERLPEAGREAVDSCPESSRLCFGGLRRVCCVYLESVSPWKTGPVAVRARPRWAV